MKATTPMAHQSKRPARWVRNVATSLAVQKGALNHYSIILITPTTPSPPPDGCVLVKI